MEVFRSLSISHSPSTPDPATLNTDLAVQDHHVLGVRDQPGVHGLAHSADPVQWRGVVVGPAVVLYLPRDRDRAMGGFRGFLS